MPAVDRRTFLKMGVGAGASIALARPLPAFQAEPRRVKGVIWLWMDGGMSQIHTFDPKPGTPNSRAIKAIDTAVPDIRVSELMPVCASQMERLSIIRSMSHGFGDHAVATALLHTGVEPGRLADLPPIGTILARELGPKEFPLPRYVALGPGAIPESGVLGEEYLPFRIESVQNPISNLRRNVDAGRDHDRAALLIEQNKDWSASRAQKVVMKLEGAYVQSEELMNTRLLKTFNLGEEPGALRGEYGEGFGQGCLLARRLVQAGCPFVQVGLKGWTLNPTWAIQYKELVPLLDRGLGTLVKDLAQKRLLRDTLVVCATEFGKPPAGDREYWSNGFSVVLAGGSLAGGRVVGDTGAAGTACASPVSVKDLFATIYLACGIDPETEYKVEGRKYPYVKGGYPLPDLFQA